MALPTRPELTPSQQELADTLIATRMEASVGRRRPLGSGTKYGGMAKDGFELYSVDRLTAMIDFPVHPGEFTGKQHEINPARLLLPYYMSPRNAPADVIDMMGFSLSEQPIAVTPDFCAGIPNAGDLLAQAFSKHSRIPTIKVLQKETTPEGRKISSNGKKPVGTNNRLVLVDNAVATAESVLESIRALEPLGWNITAVLEVFDREEGGFQRLARLHPNTQCLAALDCRPAFQHYLEKERISRYRYYKVHNYLGELKRRTNGN